MTRDQLIESAGRLTTPSPEALEEFSEKRGELSSKVIGVMGARADLPMLVGPKGRPLAEDNNRNFPLFMESVMAHYEPEVLTDTAVWAFRAYRAHGFQVTFWPANLGTWLTTLREDLSPSTFEEVAPFFTWLLTNIPGFSQLTEPTEAFERSQEGSHPSELNEG